jgi:lysophospholipase L1-like esterase
MTERVLWLLSLILSIVLSILLIPFLGAMELWARISHQRPWYQEHRSNWGRFIERLGSFPLLVSRGDRRAAPNSGLHELNLLGLRDRDYERAPSSDTFRILIIGDSFTEGDGVDDSESTLPKQLEALLNARQPLPGFSTYEVINSGLRGSLTFQWVDRLLLNIEWYDPNVVIAVFFTRDGTQLTSMGHFFQPIRQRITAMSGALNQRFALLRRARQEEILEQLARSQVNLMRAAYLGAQQSIIEWQNAKCNLVQMRDICSERGVQFVLANFPTLYQLDDLHPFQEIYDVIDEFATQNEIAYVDLFPFFKGADASSLWVSTNDQHPNALGHQIAARALFAYLSGSIFKQLDTTRRSAL